MRPLDPRLLKYARSARRHILTTAALGILTAVLIIIQALLISGAISPIITKQGTTTEVLPLVWALLLVITLRALLHAIREATAHRAADRAIRELREAVITRSEARGPRWRAQHGADTTTLLTRGLDDLSPYFVKFLPQLFLTVTVTPLALATILYLDFWSALIAAVVVPIIPIFMILIGRFTQESSKAKLATMERLSSQLLDLMAGLPTLRGLGRENAPRAHLRRLGAQNTTTTMATLRVAFLSGAVLEFLATLSVALVAVEVGMRLVYGNISLFSGLAVIMLAPEVFEPLRQVGAQFHASANGVAAAEAAFGIIEEENDTDNHTDRRTLAPDMRHYAISFTHLSVAARGAWAPDALNARIEPGTITALTGVSGAGKTTSVMVMLGVQQPDLGEVLLVPTSSTQHHSASSTDNSSALVINDTLTDAASNGTGVRVDADISEPPTISLSSLDLTSWWNHITWVPQAPTILPGSVYENIAGNTHIPTDGATDPTLARLTEAAHATGFDSVLATLPNGWATRIGHGGVGLSVGQRQRLALTRALLEESQIVILDEPTAHLDAMSEETIISTIEHMKKSGRTVIVIAHRQAVVAHADTVINVQSRQASEKEIETFPQLRDSTTEERVTVTLPGILNDLHDDATVEVNTQ